MDSGYPFRDYTMRMATSFNLNANQVPISLAYCKNRFVEFRSAQSNLHNLLI